MIASLILSALGFIDKLLSDPKNGPQTKKLICSIAHKIWDAFTTDPKYSSKLEVEEQTLAAPDLTVEERQDALKAISDSHPDP